MDNINFTHSDLINLLIKKASGFYYTEEQCEYEKTQNKHISDKNNSQNLSFFENFDRGDNKNNPVFPRENRLCKCLQRRFKTRGSIMDNSCRRNPSF